MNVDYLAGNEDLCQSFAQGGVKRGVKCGRNLAKFGFFWNFLEKSGKLVVFLEILKSDLARLMLSKTGFVDNFFWGKCLRV